MLGPGTRGRKWANDFSTFDDIYQGELDDYRTMITDALMNAKLLAEYRAQLRLIVAFNESRLKQDCDKGKLKAVSVEHIELLDLACLPRVRWPRTEAICCMGNILDLFKMPFKAKCLITNSRMRN